MILGVLPTPLHAAAVNGNKPLLQRLLHEGKCIFLFAPIILMNVKKLQGVLVMLFMALLPAWLFSVGKPEDGMICCGTT